MKTKQQIEQEISKTQKGIDEPVNYSEYSNEANRLRIQALRWVLEDGMLQIPSLGIEVEAAVHDHGVAFKDVVISEGMRLLTLSEAGWVANNLAKELELKNGKNDFYFQQPFDLNAKNKRAAWLGHLNSCLNMGFNIDTTGDLYDSDAARGVLLCRPISKKAGE